MTAPTSQTISESPSAIRSEPEVNYRYVAGVNNFNQIPRFDATDIYSDTNEMEYGLTQRLFLKRLHPTPCGQKMISPPNNCSQENRNCGEVSRQWLSLVCRAKILYTIDPTFPEQRGDFRTPEHIYNHTGP